MRILVLSPVIPHAPVDGDRLRLFHFLRELSARHEIVLAGFCSGRAELEAAQTGPLRGLLAGLHTVALSPARRRWNALRSVFSPQPANLSSMRSSAMERLVAGLAAGGGFDAVFSYRLKMAPYALQTSLPRALDLTDSMQAYFSRRAEQETGFLKRLMWRRESRKLEDCEAAMVRDFGACFVNSVPDGELLKRLSGREVEVVPNGVDTAYFHPGRQARRPGHLVFVGNMVYPPNVKAVLDFCRDCLPLIRRRLPGARLTVVGGNPVQAVRDLAADPGILVTGAVEDTRPFVWGAKVSVCPVSLGAGRQNKVLESFALGTPVVASGLSADGVEARDGKHLLVADNPRDFADAVVRLCREPQLASRLSAQALAMVRRRYHWGRSARQIEDGLKRILKQGGRKK